MVFIQEIIYLNKSMGPCIINHDEYKSTGTHWIASYVNGNNVKLFDSFEVEHILKEVEKFIGNKNIITNIYTFCISTSHIPANIPHPTSRTSLKPNIPHPEHPTSLTSHIRNIPHPEHPTSGTSHISNIPQL